MSDKAAEIARLEAEIAERQARLRELQPPLTLEALKRMSPRDVARLDRDEINRALAAGPAPLDLHGPAGVTAADLRRMSPAELVAFEKEHPEAYATVLAGGHTVLNGSNGKG